MVAMAQFDQASYAFYAAGTESGSTQIGTTDTQTTLTVNTNLQARLLVQESNSGNGNFTSINWEFNHNSGGWTAVFSAVNVLIATTDPGLTDLGDTTQRIGSGTFITPNQGVTTDGNTPNLSYSANEECEFLLSFKILGPDVSDGDEILLRIQGCDTFTLNADINVNKPATTRRIMSVT